MIEEIEKTPSLFRALRKDVLGVTQKQMAEITGTSQPSVSRWEDGSLSPSAVEMSRIREFARKNGKPWSDSWFFESPTLPALGGASNRGAA